MASEAARGLDQEKLWRAQTYRLLARLLAAPPDHALLEILRNVNPQAPEQEEAPLAQAWRQLSNAAATGNGEAMVDEYQALFIGVTGGEVVPYASWYLTGFLMEKPLAGLRHELARLGVTRQESVHEPEDHAAALLETMSLLVQDGDPRQWSFLETHLLIWLPDFFRDLQQAPSTGFYRSVGGLGQSFLALEKKWLEAVTAKAPKKAGDSTP